MSNLGSFQQVTFTLHGFIHQLGTSSSCIIQLPEGGTVLGSFYLVDSHKVSDYTVSDLQEVLNTIYQGADQLGDVNKKSKIEPENSELKVPKIEIGTDEMVNFHDGLALQPQQTEHTTSTPLKDGPAGIREVQDHVPVNYPSLCVRVPRMDIDCKHGKEGEQFKTSSKIANTENQTFPAMSANNITELSAGCISSGFGKRRIQDEVCLNNMNKKVKERKQIWTCKYCTRHFIGLKPLEEHLHVHHHQQESLHSCKPCGRSFATKARWRRHILKCSNASCTKASCCGTIFADEETLQQHKLTNCLLNKPWKCSSCNKRFRGIERLREHVKDHENKSCECGTCGADFSDVEKLKIHMKNNSHGGFANVCATCNRSFSKRSRLLAHMTIHQTQKSLLCSVCGKQFRHSGTLAHHVWFHKKGKTKECQICGEMFYDLGRLKIHEKTHKPLCCRFCNTVFHSNVHKSQHERIIHKDRDGEVNTAHKALKSLGKLQCNFCGKFVKYASHFWHNEKCAEKHICTICNAYCDNDSSMSAHVSGHQGSYKCSLCKEETLDWDSMTKHIQDHQEKTNHGAIDL